MTRVYVGIGSNIEREQNIIGGAEELKKRFGELVISPVYESEAFGFDGDEFFNLVIGFDTEDPIESVASQLREIEFLYGRKRNEIRYSSRTLDIDLLLYGDEVNKILDVPREDIEQYGFVLKPLCDIDPTLVHPVNGESILNLWNAFSSTEQHMKLSLFKLKP